MLRRRLCSRARLLPIVVLLVAGVAATSTETIMAKPATLDTKAFKLGYSTKFLNAAYLAKLQSLTLKVAAKQGIQTLQPTNANQDPAKQITDIQTLISEGAQGLIVIPTDGKAILPAIRLANSRHIPVVTIDDAPDGAGASMVVRTDNILMGETACRKMGALLHGHGTVLELQGDLATPNGRDRTSGFERCMTTHFPKIEIIARPTKWQTQLTADETQTVLTSTRNLSGVYMESDTVMLAPVLNVLKIAHKSAKVGQRGHIALVSIDGSPPALQAIRHRQLDALVSQPLNLYAKYGVYYVAQAVAGRTFKLGPTNHRSKIVMFKGNKEDALPAPLVTKKNVNDPTLWANERP